MRTIVLALLVAVPCVLTLSAARADPSSLQGQWTWSYPAASAQTGSGTMDVGGITQREQGTLALDPRGGWTVELPSAIVGCAAGKPMYTPKAGTTALVQTFPDGSCRLFVLQDGHYRPLWQMGASSGSTFAGPARGYGDFS